MPASVVGRDVELAALRDFLSGIPEGASALVLEGEAGMGKTTLWRAAVEEARATCRVLEAVPAESETALSFSGIGDLLDPVLDEVLGASLPAQQRALSRALALDDEGPAPDPHGVGVSVLNAVRALASDGTLVVAVDDVQWLDAPSCAALAYAARRLRGEPVALLLARRSAVRSPLVDELRRTSRFTAVEVGPLKPTALNQALQEQLAVTLPRPVLMEVHEASGGNPFYALEIVRMLKRSEQSIEAGQPIRVPDSLYDLVHGRLRELPPESRDFLCAAAAHAHPTLSITEAASGVPCADGLRPALDAGIVRLDGERIRFSHPLLAAGATELVDPMRRREIHVRLADLLEDPEARAWQLAASVADPDEGVAAALEAGAGSARARGAPRPAALLLERAAALTPPAAEADVRRRRMEAAYAHHAAGDTERARSLLEPALASATRGPERAGLLVALARIQSYDNDLRGACALYEQALAEATPGSLVEAYAQEGFGGTLFRLRERLADAVQVLGAAASAAQRLGVPELEAETLGTKALSEAALGRAEAAETAGEALRHQAACTQRPVLRQPLFATTVVRFWHDDLMGARAGYESMAEVARELGDESSGPYVSVMLSQIDCALGRFDEARREAADGYTIAEQAGQRALAAYTLAVRALAEAFLGRREDVSSAATRALELARATNGVPAWIFATWAIGHLALARGDARGAVDVLRPLAEHHRSEDIEEPGALPFLPDYVEALVECGMPEDAGFALGPYESAARRLGRRRGVAAAQRLRGLLAAANGDLELATTELESAVELYEREELPFEVARARLLLGVTQRRMKQRREARATLEEALAVFERIGAVIWADRARAELKRISGRAATPGALTPAEERVAFLVAEGKTNKEVAAALFLSDRTVEGHLARVFGKLGIRHRAELAGALQTQGITRPNTGDSPVSAESSAS